MNIPKEASFEGLPIELRFEIYSYLLFQRKTLTNREISEDQKKFRNGVIFTFSFSLAIFQINRRIGRESIEYFKRKNTWVSIGIQTKLVDQKSRDI